MRASAVAGIIIANSRDSLLGKLTSIRSMAAVPFGTHYRIVDFALSNLVNARITNVGVITKGNYRSLMDHVGNGIAWDLDRKNGGLYILPPYLTRGVRKYTNTVDALYGAMDYINRCGSEYIIVCDSYALANIDKNRDLRQKCIDKSTNYVDKSEKNVDKLVQEVIEQIDINIKYDGYIKRQLKQVEQFKKLETKRIPEDINYDEIKSLRIEAVQKLKQYCPISIGQASRISGVSPADISVLLVYMEQYRK